MLSRLVTEPASLMWADHAVMAASYDPCEMLKYGFPVPLRTFCFHVCVHHSLFTHRPL